jgi:pseudouridine-5'-phosphate glycosidase
VLIANPIDPADELDPAEIEQITRHAVADARERGVRGKAITPFLLARIHELTGGASEQANKSLVWSNARLAAQIATALAARGGIRHLSGRHA